MAYSIPYLLLLIFFGVCALLYEYTEDENKKKNFIYASVFVFFIFFAFRGYLYTDWVNYVEYFERVEWEDIVSWDITSSHYYEPGFVLLNLICKAIIPDYSFLVFVCISIDTVLFIRFFKRMDINNLAFVFFLFIVFEGLGIMFNLLRNAISLFILMNALEYIEKRKPLHYFSMCLLALSFHLSSIIFFPLYFFLHKRVNKWIFLSVFLTFFTMYICNVSVVLLAAKLLGMGGFFTSQIEAYTEFFTSSRELSISGTFEKAGIAILVFLYYDEIFSRFKNSAIIINSLLIYFFMYYLLADFKTLSSRFSILFIYSYWVIWIYLVKVLYIGNNRKLLAGVLFLYCFYVLKMSIGVPCQEYDNILFGSKSYQERLIIFNRTYEDEDRK